MVKILITESLQPEAIDIFRQEGWEVDLLRDLGEPLDAVIDRYDALIIRSGTRLTADLLERARRLRVIGRPGAGVDNVDLDAATRRGILVMNTPGQNSIAAAEHTIALILAALRHLYPACHHLKNHQWDRKAFMGSELADKTVGVVGLGRIGREVARRLMAFRARVIAYDPYVPVSVARDLGVELVPFEELLARSDIITLHAPKTEETKNLVNRDAMSRMKKGMILVNCARGDLIDEEALLEALEAGRIEAAALDVFREEPPRDWRLIDHPRVVATPHLGGATREAQVKVGMEIARQVRDYLKSGLIRNAVNFPSIPEVDRERVLSAMRLAYILGQLGGYLSDFRIQRIEVHFYGSIARHMVQPYVAAAVAGVLRPSIGRGVNWVNALSLAEGRQLMIHEIRHHETHVYEWMIELHVFDEHEDLSLAGTVVSPGYKRLVSIRSAFLDVPLSEHMVFIRNDDIPGVIGEVGRCMAEAGINIAYFSLARVESTGQAIGVMGVDSPVPAAVIERIRSRPYIRFVRSVTLELNPPTEPVEEDE